MNTERLMRASDTIGLPVVALDSGEDIAEIKDVVYDSARHVLVGFTLNKRGWLAGKLKTTLSASSVAAIGADAVIVDSADDLASRDGEGPAVDVSNAYSVMGNNVLTEDGNRLGEVSGVIIDTGDEPEAVGYEVTNDSGTVFVPIAAQMSVSGQNLVVPATATEFVRNDLAGFGAAIASFRSQLGAES